MSKSKKHPGAGCNVLALPCAQHEGGDDFEKTLFLMFTSEKYYPSMVWVAGAQGRALDKNKAMPSGR